MTSPNKPDIPTFDTKALQASLTPQPPSTQQQFDQSYPQTAQFLKQHRHTGNDAERIQWTDIAAPIPNSAAAFMQVQSNASTFAPQGWTLNHSATGTYVITHNLGTTNYAVFATPITTKVFAVSTAKTSASTTLIFYNTSNTATDTDFLAMVLLVPFGR